MKGVDLLSDLFLDTRDPTYIFNQGRCFQQNNRYEDAISRFREYLRKATSITPQERADTERYIEECQRLLQAPQPPVSPTAPQIPPAAASDGSSAPPPASALPLVPVTSASATPTDSGRGLRIAGIGVGAAGLASVGIAVYYYTRARAMSDKVSSSDNPSAADQQAGKDAETMQWIFYTAGGASLVAGTVMYVLGSSSSRRGSVTSVSPVLGPSLVGLAAQGAF